MPYIWQGKERVKGGEGRSPGRACQSVKFGPHHTDYALPSPGRIHCRRLRLLRLSIVSRLQHSQHSKLWAHLCSSPHGLRRFTLGHHRSTPSLWQFCPTSAIRMLPATSPRLSVRWSCTVHRLWSQPRPRRQGHPCSWSSNLARPRGNRPKSGSSNFPYVVRIHGSGPKNEILGT